MSEEKIKAFLQDIIDCNFNQPLVDNITSDVAKNILDYITNLQEEIERQSKAQVILDNQIAEMYDYKSRNEKAIEYLEHEQFKRILLGFGRDKYLENIKNEAINILQGDDKDVKDR